MSARKSPIRWPVCLAALLLAACGSSLLNVQQPVPANLARLLPPGSAFHLEVAALPPGTLPEKQQRTQAKALDKLRQSMYDESAERGFRSVASKQQARLHVHLRFTAYNPGSAVARFFLGQSAPNARAAVEVHFRLDDKPAGELNVLLEGNSGLGLIGGSINYSLDNGARSILDYMARNFLQ